MVVTKYQIVDVPLNRTHYSRFIGKICSEPPPYAVVREVKVEMITPEESGRLHMLEDSLREGY